MLKKVDSVFHKHFKSSLLIVKAILIPITIIYFILVLVIDIMEKKDEQSESLEKFQKFIRIFNNILFYVIIVFVILICIAIMFITRTSSTYILKEIYNKVASKKQKSETKMISIPSIHLQYYISIIWWMLLYLVLVTIFVSIAKSKHDPQLIYNMF